MKDKDKTFFKYPEFKNIRDIIYYTLERFPENIAFRIKEKHDDEIRYKDIKYKEFMDDVNNLGTGLYSLGLQHKKIGIISKNRYEWALSFVSTLLGGMVAVPLDKGLTDIEIENSLIRADVQAIIYEEKYAEIISKLKDSGKLNIKNYICMDEIENTTSLKEIMNIGMEKFGRRGQFVR